jgi:hypothetical protein
MFPATSCAVPYPQRHSAAAPTPGNRADRLRPRQKFDGTDLATDGCMTNPYRIATYTEDFTAGEIAWFRRPLSG